MLDRTEDRDALRALANAIISWKFRHAHDVEGFREVDECLRRAEDVLRKAGYFGDAAPLELAEDDASGIDI
jgi:predicted ArsR family transcriptional regulator